MPRNTKGGKGHKKGKNKPTMRQRQLLLRDGPEQDYGLVTKVLGSMRFDLQLTNDKQVQGHVRGKMRKRQWVRLGDLVLFSIRDVKDNKVDIIHKYTEDQAKQVRKMENLAFSGEDSVTGTGQSGARKIIFETGDDRSDDEQDTKRVNPKLAILDPDYEFSSEDEEFDEDQEDDEEDETEDNSSEDDETEEEDEDTSASSGPTPVPWNKKAQSRPKKQFAGDYLRGDAGDIDIDAI